MLVGKTAAFRTIRKEIKTIAAMNTHCTTVVISGESGSGKEVVAREIHALASLKKPLPFAAVNCSTIGRDVFESEMFGHRKGAFTGADSDKEGLVHSALDGVLFLDEIGDFPLQQQPKLLRVLQEHKVRRVGAMEEEDIFIRFVISATHRSLPDMVKEGLFRQDLWYRISTHVITLPPLREHKEDIPLLIEHFLQQKGLEKPVTLHEDTLVRLQEHSWPGNVRELHNIMERALLKKPQGVILPEDLKFDSDIYGNSPDVQLQFDPDSITLPELKTKVEEEYLRKLGEKYGWNASLMANHSGCSSRTIYRLLEKYPLSGKKKKNK